MIRDDTDRVVDTLPMWHPVDNHEQCYISCHEHEVCQCDVLRSIPTCQCIEGYYYIWADKRCAGRARGTCRMLFHSELTYTSCFGQHSTALAPSILLYEPYANESSQMSFSSRAGQFDSDHHQSSRLSSHSYSHESVMIFCIFRINIFKVTASLRFFS